jgi:hypothetical protein
VHVQVGTISDVRFTNITATAEAGIVVAGCQHSTIDGVTFDGLQLDMVKQTDEAGAFLDYRPSPRDVIDVEFTSAILIEFANHASLNNVEVRMP